MKVLRNKWFIALLVLVLIGVVVGFDLNRTPPPKYFSARAQQGTINDVVQATGTINAVTTVQVGSQVSGTISKLFVDFNSRVKAGQVVAIIEPSLFQGALLQAKADLQNARANLTAAQADLTKANATALQTKADFNRTVALTNAGVMSPQQLDLARANADTAQAAVGAAQAMVKQAAAQVSQKQAAVSVAQTNLDHTVIHAPINGIVVARNVDVGQTVAASLQAPTLFNIAQDLTKMQVDTQTDESDVGNMKVGQEATFKVDAFPKDSFRGRVVQIRLNPTTVQNVVTYDTVLNFDNPKMKLFPGMTAYVSIPVATAENVLEVPNSALRFKPDLTPEQLRAAYEKYGIQKAQNDDGTSPSAAARPPKSARGAATGATPAPQMRSPRVDVGVVWKLQPDKSLEPVLIRAGITDHTATQVAQVLKGNLQPGDELAIGSAVAAQKPSSTPQPGSSVRGR
jgi:HlyD family secretion protein